MSSGGTGGGGIIIRNAEVGGPQVIVTKAQGQAIVDALLECGNTTLANQINTTLANQIQPIVNAAG